MSERPILFNQDMVKAILEGRKSSTRRIIKPQPPIDCHSNFIGAEWRNEPPSYYDTGDNNWACKYCGYGIGLDGKSIFHAPYQVGDVLYVRETWCIQAAHRFGADARIEFKAGGIMQKIQFKNSNSQSINRDDYDKFVNKWWNENGKWHPSIFMPRAAARIFLKVTNAKVQRVQDITDEEAWKEGNMIKPLICKGRNCNDCKHATKNYKGWGDCYEGDCQGARYNFKNLWNSLYEKKGYGWDVNPWVWVFEFERCEKAK